MSEISKVYKNRNNFEKALEYMTTSRKYLEYMSMNHPQNVPNTDHSDDPIYEEHKLYNLLYQMHEAFNKPDSPSEIIKNLQ